MADGKNEKFFSVKNGISNIEIITCDRLNINTLIV